MKKFYSIITLASILAVTGIASIAHAEIVYLSYPYEGYFTDMPSAPNSSFAGQYGSPYGQSYGAYNTYNSYNPCCSTPSPQYGQPYYPSSYQSAYAEYYSTENTPYTAAQYAPLINTYYQAPTYTPPPTYQQPYFSPGVSQAYQIPYQSTSYAPVMYQAPISSYSTLPQPTTYSAPYTYTNYNTAPTIANNQNPCVYYQPSSTYQYVYYH